MRDLLLIIIGLCFVVSVRANIAWNDSVLFKLTKEAYTSPRATLDSISYYLKSLEDYTGNPISAHNVLTNLQVLSYFILDEKEEARSTLDNSDYQTNLEGSRLIGQLLTRAFITPPSVSEKIKSFSDFWIDLSVENNNEFQLFAAYNLAERIYELEENISAAFALNYQMLDLHEIKANLYSVLTTVVYSNLGRLSRMMSEYEKALVYHQTGLKLTPDTTDYLLSLIINHKANIGNIYRESNKYQKAYEIDSTVLDSRILILDTSGIVYQYTSLAISLINLDKLRKAKINIDNAIRLLNPTMSSYQKNKSRIAYAQGLYFTHKKQYNLATRYCKEGYQIAINSMDDQRLMRAIENCECIFDAYDKAGNEHNAYMWFRKLHELRDSLFSKRNSQSLLIAEMNSKFQNRVYLDSLKQVEKELFIELQHEEEVRKKNMTRNILGALGFLVLIIAGGLYSRLNYVRKSKIEITKERDRSDFLLLNILPAEIAAELKEKGEAAARNFDTATILFTDFKEFTQLSEKLNATDLVAEINYCFRGFDSICDKFGIEKIKTIGDSYMAAGGLPVPSDNSVKNTVLAALEMQVFINKRKSERIAEGQVAFEMRAGINTGPVVAGIVGVKKFQYDLWGDTVNTASRMESNGEVAKVNISKSTFEILKDDPEFTFESRGKIMAKGKGEVEMYFVSDIV